VETALNKVPRPNCALHVHRRPCENAGEPFFGLSIPQWSFAWFAIFAIGLLWTLLRRREIIESTMPET
jgi:disulfide bond formation protein DsbB